MQRPSAKCKGPLQKVQRAKGVIPEIQETLSNPDLKSISPNVIPRSSSYGSSGKDDWRDDKNKGKYGKYGPRVDDDAKGRYGWRDDAKGQGWKGDSMKGKGRFDKNKGKGKGDDDSDSDGGSGEWKRKGKDGEGEGKGASGKDKGKDRYGDENDDEASKGHQSNMSNAKHYDGGRDDFDHADHDFSDEDLFSGTSGGLATSAPGFSDDGEYDAPGAGFPEGGDEDAFGAATADPSASAGGAAFPVQVKKEPGVQAKKKPVVQVKKEPVGGSWVYWGSVSGWGLGIRSSRSRGRGCTNI